MIFVVPPWCRPFITLQNHWRPGLHHPDPAGRAHDAHQDSRLGGQVPSLNPTSFDTKGAQILRRLLLAFFPLVLTSNNILLLV